MVALSPRFTTLAALCAIAALTAITPPANAAAINLRRDVADLSNVARDSIPVPPLPPRDRSARFGSTSRELQNEVSSSIFNLDYESHVGSAPFPRYFQSGSRPL